MTAPISQRAKKLVDLAYRHKRATLSIILLLYSIIIFAGRVLVAVFEQPTH